MKINNTLALRAAFHQEMAMMLQDDSTSKSDFKFSDRVHAKAKQMAKTSSLKEALKKAAEHHQQKYIAAKKEFEDKHQVSFEEYFELHEDDILDSFKISDRDAEAALFGEPELSLEENSSLEE